MLVPILTGIGCFIAGFALGYLIAGVIYDYLTQGRAAYMAFINAMEDPHE